MGIHKYGLDASSSQLEYLGLMRMDLDHALLCVTCFVLNMLCDMCGDCMNNRHGRLYMEQ